MTETFSTILKKKMNEKKITQAELARQIDVADTSVYRYMKGIAKPRKLLLNRIANVLGCSTDDF